MMGAGAASDRAQPDAGLPPRPCCEIWGEMGGDREVGTAVDR